MNREQMAREVASVIQSHISHGTLTDVANAVLDAILPEQEAQAAAIIDLSAALDRLMARTDALLELFTYESLGEPGRLYARFHGVADVTNEVNALLRVEP